MWFLRRMRVASGLLLLWLGVATLGVSAWAQSTPPPPEPQAPPALDGPATGAEALPARDATRAGSSADTGRVYAPKAPPAPVVERPSGDRPDRNARWIAGYWAWDPAQDEFAWVGGSWQIPPAGSIWMAGRWERDAGGWYWVPGTWSRRGNPAGAAANRPAWRTTGPPADHPDDVPAPAPGADYFFVPGHYAPDGDRLGWTSGFWSRLQPGWDWIPARWVRRPNGWDFREGYWVRDPAAAVVITDPRVRRRSAARPYLFGRPPVVVESRPGAAGGDRLPPPPGTVIERDPIAEAEAAGRLPAPDEDVDVIIGPVVGAPYYVIRPPGMYPYGPGGVVVPGAVPPFVRRLLDRVLP
jgi:hypothetical protein